MKDRLVDDRLTPFIGEVDHRVVDAPYLRLVRVVDSEGYKPVTVWDLRLTQPNAHPMTSPVVHTLEHMLAVYLPQRIEGVINVGPMGCQTGYYIAMLGMCSYEELIDSVADALRECADASTVPLASPESCGQWKLHDLAGAKDLARDLLESEPVWTKIVK